ncbi:MAG: polysaccharide biosynthesis protein [Pseudomonadota bacterium]
MDSFAICRPAVPPEGGGSGWAVGGRTCREAGASPHRPPGSDLGRVLILGTGADGQALLSALRGLSGTRVVGAIACPPDRVPAGIAAHPLSELRVAATGLGAETAVFAAPDLAGPVAAEIARLLREAGLRLFSLPGYSALLEPIGVAARLMPVPGGASATGDCPVDDAGKGPGMGPGMGAVNGGGSRVADYRGQTVLVTGAEGSIGGEICRQLLLQHPRRIVLFDLSEDALDRCMRELRIRACGTRTEIAAVLGSVTDAALVSRTLRQNAVDTVFHAAAYKHVPVAEEQPEAVFRNNTIGTAILAQKSRDAGAGRFVLVSTDKAVCPAGVMGASKRLAEIVVQDLAARGGDTIFSIVRFGNVIGSSGSVVLRFRDQIALGGPITLTDPAATRYFMTAEDAAGLVITAGALAKGGEMFALDMGAPHRIIDIAARMIGAACSDRIDIVTTGLRPGEKLHEKLTLSAAVPAAPRGDGTRILRLHDPCPSGLAVALMLRDLREALDQASPSGLVRVARRWAGAAVPDLAGRCAPPRAVNG